MRDRMPIRTPVAPQALRDPAEHREGRCCQDQSEEREAFKTTVPNPVAVDALTGTSFAPESGVAKEFRSVTVIVTK